ncbi:TRAP transporter substrate-binding protein DctP [Blastococcus saxobsidens]|nr:TRAP transporter substrate-binding protein DctP [Blastococcus saxobsidens]
MTVATAACGSGDTDSGEETAAAEEVQIRVADQYSTEHPIAVASILPFMEEVERQSDGRITFEYFGSNELVEATDIPSAIQDGIADMGNLLYIGSVNPLMYVVQLPGLYADPETGAASEALLDFVTENENVAGTLDETGIHPLICLTTTNYQILTSGPVNSPQDLQGRQLRASGNVLPLSIDALGAVPVNLSINETYEAINRGVVDGVSISVPSVREYAFTEVAPNVVVNVNLGGFPVCYGISEGIWDELSPEDQELMTSVGREISRSAGEELAATVEEQIAEWESSGVTVVTFDEAERSAAADALSSVEERWIEDLEESGIADAGDAVEQWKTTLEEALEGER